MRHPKGNDKINYVKDFIMDACDAPYQVYFTCLFPALLEAILAYYALDMVQMFTRYVRPPGIYQGRRNGPHGAGSRKKPGTKTWRRYWRNFSSFDPSDKTGQFWPGSGLGWYRPITPGVRTLWTLFDIQQRFMYYWMVIDITEQFFYKWASGVAASRYCQEQYRPWVSGTFTLDAHFGTDRPTGIVIEDITKARHGATMSGSGGRSPGYGSSAIFSCRLDRDFPPSEIDASLKCVLLSDDGQFIEGSPFGAPGGESVVSGSTMGLGVHWTFALAGSRGYMVEDGVATIIGTESYLEQD